MSLESRGTVPGKRRFIEVSTLEDTMAVRCADFHPMGHLFAVGSNSKSLHICRTPSLTNISRSHHPPTPDILHNSPTDISSVYLIICSTITLSDTTCRVEDISSFQSCPVE